MRIPVSGGGVYEGMGNCNLNKPLFFSLMMHNIILFFGYTGGGGGMSKRISHNLLILLWIGKRRKETIDFLVYNLPAENSEVQLKGHHNHLRNARTEFGVTKRRYVVLPTPLVSDLDIMLPTVAIISEYTELSLV